MPRGPRLDAPGVLQPVMAHGREGKGSGYGRFDLHQTLTEPGDTLPKIFGAGDRLVF